MIASDEPLPSTSRAEEEAMEPEMKLGVPPPFAHQRIVIAGFGNALRGDDGAGWHVARRLAALWGDGLRADGSVGNVCILTGHQPLPEWVPILAGADLAYFIDAAVVAHTAAAERSGTERLMIRPLSTPDQSTQSTGESLNGHALGVERLLSLAQRLYGYAPRAYMVTLPVERLDFTEHLSPLTGAAVEKAVAMLNRIITAVTGAAPPVATEVAPCA